MFYLYDFGGENRAKKWCRFLRWIHHFHVQSELICAEYIYIYIFLISQKVDYVHYRSLVQFLILLLLFSITNELNFETETANASTRLSLFAWKCIDRCSVHSINSKSRNYAGDIDKRLSAFSINDLSHTLISLTR